MKEETKEFRVDIDEVIRKKNPKLAKRLPRFIIRYIKRILHQNEINDIIEKNKDKYGIDFVKAVLNEFEINIVLKNEENIPEAGRFIFAANHPLGALESMVLMVGVHNHFEKIRFLVNDVLLIVRNYDPIFVPINAYGRQSRDVTMGIDETYSSDAQILYFPAGLVSRKIKGKITDPEWKKSFIVKAKKHERDVIPVFLDGKNANFFYNLANFRKRIGIKANIEMFFLANETFKQKGKTITVTFGKPIPYTTFDKSKSLPDWAQHVKDIVYSMRTGK